LRAAAKGNRYAISNLLLLYILQDPYFLRTAPRPPFLYLEDSSTARVSLYCKMDRFQAVFLLSCILASSYSLAQADEQSDIIPGFSLLPFSPLDPLFVPQTNSSRDTEGATQDFLGLWKRQTCPSGYGYCSSASSFHYLSRSTLNYLQTSARAALLTTGAVRVVACRRVGIAVIQDSVRAGGNAVGHTTATQ
jgi:hypothetical protein